MRMRADYWRCLGCVDARSRQFTGLIDPESAVEEFSLRFA